MPSSNGVYSLPPGYLAVTGSTIQASQHNPPLEDIAAALTLRLSRDGSAPMTGALQAAVGSVTLPGVVFQTDASSGFYKTTNGIGVAVGGTKVAEFLAGGVSGAQFLGALIPYTGTAALPLTVIPTGQTLSRTTYAALWAMAQIEIAAGNTFYNNGDGSTTFGIGDMRGCVLAALDPLANILTISITNGPTHVGNKGGGELMTLLTTNLPPIPLSVSGTVTVSANNTLQVNSSGTLTPAGGGSTPVAVANSAAGVISTGSATLTGSAGGSSTPFTRVQPTMMANYLLFAGA